MKPLNPRAALALWVLAALPELPVAEPEPLEPVAVGEVMDARVELMTAAVEDTETLEVPTSTVKYVACQGVSEDHSPVVIITYGDDRT